MRKYLLTASLLTALLVTACGQVSQGDLEAETGSVTAAASTAEPLLEKPNEAVSDSQTETLTQDTHLPAFYRGLSPTEISQSEIKELLALQNKQNVGLQDYHKALDSWFEDEVRQEERPLWEPATLSAEDSARLKTLNMMLKNAEIRKSYEELEPGILTKVEVEDIIRLEQEQARGMAAINDEIMAWGRADPTTRGPQPEMKMSDLLGEGTRLMELQMKVESVRRVDALKTQLQEQSERYNITLSETEMTELMELQKEQMEFELEFSKAMIQAEHYSGISGDNLSEEDIIHTLPKPLLKRMMATINRQDAIKAPLEAAQKAERLKNKFAELSAESGIPILSGEMAEIIALNAKRDEIQANAENEALRKWLEEDGLFPNFEYLPNDEDYARLKEIESRLNTISAPMTDAKNAALEAENPALRQQRLQREAQQKWQNDWRDKKQSGEVPPGTPLSSPSYAELQDRVQDYEAKLQARAAKVGYEVLAADPERLSGLNKEMLDIRKAVFDAEKDGSSHTKGQYGQKTPTFETAAQMYKIKLIEKKQQEILADLSETESLQNGFAQSEASETGELPFEYHTFGQVTGDTTIESIIDSFRMNDIEISQSEIDDLRTFERELKGR